MMQKYTVKLRTGAGFDPVTFAGNDQPGIGKYGGFITLRHKNADLDGF
jgi:hypothetical protein